MVRYFPKKLYDGPVYIWKSVHCNLLVENENQNNKGQISYVRIVYIKQISNNQNR